MDTTLRLSDILARPVGIEWFEAVALVREVADRVRESVGGRGVPDLDQVQLAEDGGVSITGATKTDEPVRRLGQLLLACLVQAEPPVQLRLVVTQATAPEPGYGSIRDFSDALAYFERPERALVLQGLFARALSAPASASDTQPTLDAIAPLQTPESVKDSTRKRLRKRQVSWRAVGSIAAIVTLVAAATVYSQLRSAAALRTDVSALAVKASDTVGTTLVKGISAVSETVGLGRLVPAQGSGAAPAVVSPTSSGTAAVKRSTPQRPRKAPEFRLFDLETPPIVSGIPAAVARSEVELIAPSAPPVAPIPPDETVYSSDDPAVSPPIGVRPQLPRVLPSDIQANRLSEIELVVLPDGTVGSVKLRGAHRGVLEGMLLSAAKAWTFKPAEKNGRPVAYRKTVWLVRE